MGISRSRGTAGHWKGYIDEVKVYGRAFTADNVTDACLLYEECEKYVAPKAPTGLTATGGSGQVALTWNATTGADNYTVYYSTDNSSFTAISPVVTGTSYTHTSLSTSTTYYYYIKANNTAGTSGESNLATATTGAANGVTITHSNGSTTVNEGGYGQGFYDWSEITSPNAQLLLPEILLVIFMSQVTNQVILEMQNITQVALNNGLVQ